MTDQRQWLTWIPRPVDPGAVDLLSAVGDVALGYGHDATSWEDVAPRATGVLLRTESFGARQIAVAPRLRIIARHGVGYDTVDIGAAAERGIPVTVTGDANAQSVAEHVFALLLAVVRRITHAHSETSEGRWVTARNRLVGHELAGRRLGLLGCGRIGRRVVRIAHAFGMDVSVSDPALSAEDAHRLEVLRVGQEDLLCSSDVLSLHAPLIAATRHIIDDEALTAMPSAAVVINTARGGLIDERALVRHLHRGHIAGAGLDVLEDEPPAADNPLLAHPGVLITPHIGGQTEQAMRRVATDAARSVLDAYAARPLRHVVNQTQLAAIPASALRDQHPAAATVPRRAEPWTDPSD